jgi:3-hydroxybutyryl-CoA dehydrogenase
MIDHIKQIGIAGAGTMGAGIAQVFAQSGYSVVLFDLQLEALTRAEAQILGNLNTAVTKGKMTDTAKTETLARITYTSQISDLIGQVIIEAIIERLDVKRELLATIASHNPIDTLLLTNTSSLSITQIAKGMPEPSRFAGMHFFNPAHLMKLVEVVSGAETSPEVAEIVRLLTIQLDKSPVMVLDAPGFIVNRVARHYYVESLRILEERAASMEHIDALMESAGFKMGPFKLMDTIGHDINYAVTSSLYEAFYYDPKFRPSRIQQQKVDAGHLGKKSGKGFYQY